MKKNNDLVIYQAKNGKIEFRGDFKRDTIWGSINQMADLFGVNKAAISKHLKNIYADGELSKGATVSILETVQTEGKRRIKREISYYNLDAIISVGYRVNSGQATQFRIWATKTLKQHLIEGYTINKKRIKTNYKAFQKALTDIQTILPVTTKIGAKDALELINAFSSTWISLEAYDKESFPKSGSIRKKINITIESLSESLNELKVDLVSKKQATVLFGQERVSDSLPGIIGNVFQSFGNKDVYSTNEEKAAHFLYFIIKNHPFVDGNKRSAAFTFIWYLNKAGLLRDSLSPETLTTLTILIAESKSGDKDKMIGLILLLLGKK